MALLTPATLQSQTKSVSSLLCSLLLQHREQLWTPPAPSPSSRFLVSKPFRCPKPNCNKSYKQANGLKYHITHGSYNFAPPKDLEHVKDLLERKRRERNGEREGLDAKDHELGDVQSSSERETTCAYRAATRQAVILLSLLRLLCLPRLPRTRITSRPPPPDLRDITPSDLKDIKREAERRLRPFACDVGECTRRYKNMNDLRYHYQHTDDHASMGLALLAVWLRSKWQAA